MNLTHSYYYFIKKRFNKKKDENKTIHIRLWENQSLKMGSIVHYNIQISKIYSLNDQPFLPLSYHTPPHYFKLTPIPLQLSMYMEVIHSATSTLTFSLSPNYGYVLLVATLLAFEVLFIGFIFPGMLRYKLFTEQFMMEHFGEMHKQASGKVPEKGGYPDMGNGRYSDKLTYQQWYRFNNAQRVHQNFVDFIPSCLVMLFIAGIYFPVTAAVLGLVKIIARLVYSIGYVNGGPKGRLVGALSGDLMLAGLLALSLASGIMMIQGKDSV